MPHLTTAQLEAGLADIRRSPQDNGVLKLIVRRPAVNKRHVVDVAELSLTDGLVGDNWRTRGSRATADRAAHPDMQLNLMNARAIALIARQPERWQLAGDQLFVDLDLSVNNLPAGTRLVVGAATVEITAVPHTGCRKFTDRYGKDAVHFVNSKVGKQLRLRGVNARVVVAGAIRVGDSVRKL